jgi:hypothetical protein
LRHPKLVAVTAALALATGPAAAQDALAAPAPAAPPATAPATPPPTTPAPPATPAPTAAPVPAHAWLVTAGAGYYERLHLGAAWQPGARSSLDLFAGTDLGTGSDTIWDVGFAWTYLPWRLPWKLDGGLTTKAIYWQRSSPDYGWKMMTLVFGPALSRDLSPALALVLDGGVALSFSLATDRKQDVNYEYPTRWNASVCLSLRYRFDTW